MPDILHELTIAAPVEKVYHALTDQKGLASWWTPVVAAQAKIESIAEFTFPGIVLKMRISRLEPGRGVTWSVVEAVPDWNDTQVTWDLTPVPNGTKVLLGHRNYASTEGMYARFNISWAWHFISLKDYLETGEGRPGPTPF